MHKQEPNRVVAVVSDLFFSVKISEGALYPNLSVVATASRNYDPTQAINRQTLASIVEAGSKLLVPDRSLIVLDRKV